MDKDKQIKLRDAEIADESLRSTPALKHSISETRSQLQNLTLQVKQTSQATTQSCQEKRWTGDQMLMILSHQRVTTPNLAPSVARVLIKKDDALNDFKSLNKMHDNSVLMYQMDRKAAKRNEFNVVP